MNEIDQHEELTENANENGFVAIFSDEMHSSDARPQTHAEKPVGNGTLDSQDFDVRQGECGYDTTKSRTPSTNVPNSDK